MWKKTWQMVCREEEIPEVGDHYLYQIAHMSFLIVRTGPDEFKAHWNACLHRGRRGPDRRGDRRPQPPQPQGQGPSESGKDAINVDQIVREIKARIAQRHGIDLSSSQIQELAGRRLEAILDPRTLKPSLLDQLRQSAGAPPAIAPVEPEPAYDFQDHTIFDTHNALLRAVRSLLKPILK